MLEHKNMLLIFIIATVVMSCGKSANKNSQSRGGFHAFSRGGSDCNNVKEVTPLMLQTPRLPSVDASRLKVDSLTLEQLPYMDEGEVYENIVITINPKLPDDSSPEATADWAQYTMCGEKKCVCKKTRRFCI